MISIDVTSPPSSDSFTFMKVANPFHPVLAILFLTCLGFTAIPSSLHAQGWQFVTGEYTGTAFNDAGTVLVVGEHGLIMRSTDNGTTWQLPKSNTYQTLRDVAFVNAGEALAVGDAGLLLRSEDGGETWTAAPIPDSNGTLDNLTIRGTTVWMTSHNRLLRSSDGGKTWGTALSLPDTALDLSMVTEEIGLMVAGDGTIYRTADSGKTWTSSLTEPTTRFQAISCSPNGHIGVAAGEKSRVYKTLDSGRTWRLAPVGDTVLNIFSVAVENNGLIVAGGGLHQWNDNLLYASRDTGSTWEIVRFVHAEDQAAVLSVALGRDGTGIASTNFGAILMTQDAWQTVDTIVNIKNVTLGRLPNLLYNGAIAANNTGIIPNNNSPGGYTVTTDGGITWKYEQYGILAWKSIERAGPDYLLMFGGFVSEVYRTNNAGRTWTWLGESAPEKISNLARSQALDARSIFQLHNTYDNSAGILYYSADSGKTFGQERFSEVEQYYLLDFITPEVGVLGGATLPDNQDSLREGYKYIGLFFTNDRGRNRKRIYEYSGITNAASWTPEMVDTATILLAADGRAYGLPGNYVILKTTDQGDNWEVSYTSDWLIYDLAVFNDSVWYGVGENATIVMTTDAGKTWTQETIDPLPRFRFGVVPRFRQVFLLPDDQTAMILGEGTILRKTFPQKLSGVAERGTDNKKKQALQIYPNPATDEIFVHWSGEARIKELVVFDLLGRQITIYKTELRSDKQITMDISELAPGLYQLVGKNAEGVTMGTTSVVVE